MEALILLRGLPGAGKSLLATVLSEKGRWPAFSVDDYFTEAETDSYEFRFNENHLAYSLCEENTRKAMARRISKIVVHNTFTLAWEMERYFKMAAENNYTVFVATVENYHGGKNCHGISAEQLTKMAEKYKVRLM